MKKLLVEGYRRKNEEVKDTLIKNNCVKSFFTAYIVDLSSFSMHLYNIVPNSLHNLILLQCYEDSKEGV